MKRIRKRRRNWGHFKILKMGKAKESINIKIIPLGAWTSSPTPKKKKEKENSILIYVLIYLYTSTDLNFRAYILDDNYKITFIYKFI